MKKEQNIWQRTQELMMLSIDERFADDSFAPKGFEFRDSEVRDLVRLARCERPKSDKGTAAWAQAEVEFGVSR